jgi:hypothetical protein
MSNKSTKAPSKSDKGCLSDPAIYAYVQADFVLEQLVRIQDILVKQGADQEISLGIHLAIVDAERMKTFCWAMLSNLQRSRLQQGH